MQFPKLFLEIQELGWKQGKGKTRKRDLMFGLLCEKEKYRIQTFCLALKKKNERTKWFKEAEKTVWKIVLTLS